MTEPATPRSEVEARPDAGTEGETFRRRARWGAVALGVRTAVAQVVVLLGTIVLARKLVPADFGAFAIVQFALTFLTVFGDAGLAGALIQKKTPPSERELSSVFWVQAALSVLVAAAAAGAAEGVRLVWSDLPPSAPWILRALALNFALTALRVVPTILLERELQFVRLALIDTAGTLSFYAVATAMAFAGLGIWSLVGGVVAQGVAGAVSAFAFRPFRPKLLFDRPALRGLLAFGIPHQMKHVVAFAGGATTPLLCGAILGASSVGYINWAQQTGFFPIRLVEILSRVSFPLYARFQDDRAELARQVERTLAVAVAGTCFFAGLVLGLGAEITQVIFSPKWLPAVGLLSMFAGTFVVGFLTPLFAPALDALGKPKIVLWHSVGTTLAAWVVTTPLAVLYGATGFVAGSVTLMVLGNFVMIWLVRRELPTLRVARVYVVPSLGGVAVAALGRFALRDHARTPHGLAACVVAGLVAFAVVMLLDRGLVQAVRGLLRRRPQPPAEGAPAAPGSDDLPQNRDHF